LIDAIVDEHLPPTGSSSSRINAIAATMLVKA
jgi:hypothetical protein